MADQTQPEAALEKDRLQNVVELVVEEVKRQDSRFGRFGHERKDVRLAIACLEDEVREAFQAFEGDRRDQDLGPRWAYTQGEVTQVAAIAIRLVYDILYN